MNNKTIAGALMLAGYVGILLVDFFANRPELFVPDMASGRVCPALFLYKLSPHWFYYTTYGACTVSWSSAFLLSAAAAYLAVRKYLSP